MADDQTKVTAMAAEGEYRDESAQQVSLWSLFLAFHRLGLTVLGRPAMVAYIRDFAVGKKHWLSQDCFEDGTALCESIPGATAMQTAAYVGFRTRGIARALAAFVALRFKIDVLWVVLVGAGIGIFFL